MNGELRLLMRYCDFEIEAAERARVALTLMRDREQRQRLDEWRVAGVVIRSIASGTASDSFSIEESVMARITPSEQPWTAAASGRRWSALQRLVVAAGVLLAVGFGAVGHGESTPHADVSRSVSPPSRPDTLSPVGRPSAPRGSGERGPQLAIERVDLGGRTGALFLVAVGERETPVIWLNDDEQGGRIRNL